MQAAPPNAPQGQPRSTESDAMDRVLRTLGYDPSDPRTHLPVSSRAPHKPNQVPSDPSASRAGHCTVNVDRRKATSTVLGLQDVLDAAALPRDFTVETAMALLRVPFPAYAAAVGRQQRAKADAARRHDSLGPASTAWHTEATDALVLLQWTVRRFVVRWWAYLYLAAMLQEKVVSNLPATTSKGKLVQPMATNVTCLVAAAVPALFLSPNPRGGGARKRRTKVVDGLTANASDARPVATEHDVGQCLANASRCVQWEVAQLSKWTRATTATSSLTKRQRCVLHAISPIASHAALVHRGVEHLVKHVSTPGAGTPSPTDRCLSRALASALLIVDHPTVNGKHPQCDHVLGAMATPAGTASGQHPAAAASLDQLMPLFAHRVPEALRAEVHDARHRVGDASGGAPPNRLRSGVRNGQLSFDDLANQLAAGASAASAGHRNDAPTDGDAPPLTLSTLVETAAVWRYQQHLHHAAACTRYDGRTTGHAMAGPIGWLLHPSFAVQRGGSGVGAEAGDGLDTWRALLPAACWSSRGPLEVRRMQRLLAILSGDVHHGRDAAHDHSKCGTAVSTANMLMHAEGKLMDRRSLRAAARRFLKIMFC